MTTLCRKACTRTPGRPAPVGDAVEVPAQDGHRAELVVADVGTGVARPLEEEAHGVVVGVGCARGGQAKRTERDQRLLGQVQRRPAGRQHRRGGAGVQEGGHGVGGGGRDVLAVVDHDERRLVRWRGDQGVERREPELSGDGASDRVRGLDPRQVDDVGAQLAAPKKPTAGAAGSSLPSVIAYTGSACPPCAIVQAVTQRR